MTTAATPAMTTKSEERRRRIEACLLGTAVGDALGLPCEGLSPLIIALALYPVVLAHGLRRLLP
jgi:hypothetical protein